MICTCTADTGGSLLIFKTEFAFLAGAGEAGRRDCIHLERGMDACLGIVLLKG